MLGPKVIEVSCLSLFEPLALGAPEFSVGCSSLARACGIVYSDDPMVVGSS